VLLWRAYHEVHSYQQLYLILCTHLSLLLYGISNPSLFFPLSYCICLLMYQYWSRWGLFWKSLKMNIGQSGQIISAAALVHNFIVDAREGVDEDTLDGFDEEAYFRQFSASTVAELDDSLLARTITTTRPVGAEPLEQAAAVATDNNEPNPGGRRTVASMNSKKDGFRLRSLITLHLSLYECFRPKQKGFKYNDAGMVYMDY
jgi:hypothetical protein